jgi:hypothetical protein
MAKPCSAAIVAGTLSVLGMTQAPAEAQTKIIILTKAWYYDISAREYDRDRDQHGTRHEPVTPFADVTQTLDNCSGQSLCRILVANATFKLRDANYQDPSPGKLKRLFVEWTCQPGNDHVAYLNDPVKPGDPTTMVVKCDGDD